ncbi:MAG: PilZ domain-containing protein [Syntrophobacteraceae bacterium]|jgi:hypothetical protein
MFEEKRKHKRLKGKKGAFAAFIRPNELINTGQIQDISMGGLCVRYLAVNEDNEERSEITIFGSNNRFIHLRSVQCRIVYDREVPGSSWKQISTRRCGVEFENLFDKHLSMLQDFIDHFAFDKTRKSKGQVTPRQVKTRKTSRVEIDSKRTALPSNHPDA